MISGLAFVEDELEAERVARAVHNRGGHPRGSRTSHCESSSDPCRDSYCAVPVEAARILWSRWTNDFSSVMSLITLQRR